LRDRGGFHRLESLQAVLATPASGRPKRFPLCVLLFLLEFSAEPQLVTAASLRANRTPRRQAKQISGGVRK
jgi:hypothetical protein